VSSSTVDGRVLEALRFQRAAFDLASLASPLYAAVADAVLADVGRGGPCARVLAQVDPALDPIPDAVALRFLGALHRVVLRGAAPALARWYPTAGGAFSPGDDPAADVVAAVEAHHDELVAGLDEGVQTNEVGRCAPLAVGFTALLRRFGLPLRLLEVGSSAGLNLRWDRWRYESGTTAWGEVDAGLCFGDDVYRAPAPPVDAPLGPGSAVAERRGCDRSPIDASTPAGALLLRSFVWPDQAERFARLDAALAVAARVPASVERADAGAWVPARLAEPGAGVTTVVFHSIVWQYLPASSRSAVTAAFEGADDSSPVAWLRMEPPADPARAAELLLSVRHRGHRTDELLARSGYHGRPVTAAPNWV
jgi:hypothetical protein